VHRALACVAILALTSRVARADDRDDVSTAGRVAAIAAAIVPGAVVHGAGSFVVGKRRTAKRLLAMEGVGLAAFALGAAFVQGTRGNPYTIEPGVPLAIAGAGLFLPSWLDDIWVAAGGTRDRGAALATPPWTLELGMTSQHDAYRERGLVRVAGTLELGRVGFGAAADVDAEGKSRVGELEARYLIAGDASHVAIHDGSRLSARIAARYLRDDDDRLSIATAEAELIGRLELAHLDAELRGTFVEVTTGIGVDRVVYANGARDIDSLLLGRFAWGLYLGTRGEATIFYDHRRDGLAGGFAAWRGSGFIGSFGANAQVRVAGPWAVRGELQIGDAVLTTLALRYHGGHE